MTRANRKLVLDADIAYHNYLNGNGADCLKWIGNSANRLLLVYSSAALYGSNTARQFMDWYRYRKSV